MSPIDKASSSCSSFVELSTQELEKILYDDSVMPDGGRSDEELLYIAGILAERETASPSVGFQDSRFAWERFRNEHHAFDEKKHRSRRSLFRMGLAAAAAIILLIAGVLSVSARDMGLRHLIVTWTDDYLEVYLLSGSDASNHPVGDPAPVAPQLEKLQQDMIDHGLDTACLPTYYPDGYTVSDYVCLDSSSFSSFCVVLTIGTSDIDDSHYSVAYTSYKKNSGSYGANYVFPKDAGDPELYEHAGRTYYITSNLGRYYAVWIEGNSLGEIRSGTDKSELLKIIDSTHTGGN